MTYLVAFIVCFIAGIGAGLGTGFAGMSAAAVISPMLITFLGMDPYMAVGIALASDVLASAISAFTYGKSGNLDIKNGAVMMASVLCFTLVGSYVASLVPGTTMGGFSTFMTLLLGVKFIVRPVMTTKSAMNAVSVQKRFAQSLLCGAGVGFICGFIGAGGGMMMLLLLTSVLGYELKTAVGTSVFIMAFTAFTGSVQECLAGMRRIPRTEDSNSTALPQAGQSTARWAVDSCAGPSLQECLTGMLPHPDPEGFRQGGGLLFVRCQHPGSPRGGALVMPPKVPRPSPNHFARKPLSETVSYL